MTSLGSDSEHEREDVEQHVRRAPKRLGQKAAAAPKETKVKNVEKYTRHAPLSQKKIKVSSYYLRATLVGVY